MVGFAFYVYCRSRYIQKKKHNQVSLIYIHTIYIYKLETFIHSFLSTIHAVLFLHPQIIFYLSVGNVPFMLIPKLFGIKTIINVDGMDWDREKWGKFGKWYLSFCAFLSTHLADTIVTDSLYSKEFYKKKFNKETSYIPYMTNGYKWEEKIEVLKRYGLTKGDYLVWAGRLVPDNHLEDLLYAYMAANITKKLVVMGDDNYQTEYLKKVKQLMIKDVHIIPTGFLPRDEYLTFIKNSYTYVETKQSGGTHPTLLDGLTYAPRIVCNDFEANKRIVGSKAKYYLNHDENDLKKTLCAEWDILSVGSFSLHSYQPRAIISSYKRLFIGYTL